MSLSVRRTQRNKVYRRSRAAIRSTNQSTYTASTRLNPVPTRLLTRMRYNEALVVALPVGPGLTDYEFNLNSIFQPNITGGGHQPLGHDQLATLYQRYRVFKTHYRVQITPGTTPTVFVATAATNSGTNFTTIGAAAETTFGHSGIATTAKPCVIQDTIDLTELNGKSRVAYAADDTTQAVMTASPTETQELHVVISNTAGVAQDILMLVDLIFECELTDPVQLAQS